LQGLANVSFLAIPAFVMAVDPAPSIAIMTWLGLLLWIAAYTMESVADMQKLNFLREMRKAGTPNQVCNVGLWAYSRHPNYFAEWMAWNALIIMAIPSWYYLLSSQPVVLWLTLGVALVLVSYIMYSTLVYYTGAVPAEYYSVKKRPQYEAYQKHTNRFFPGAKK
jgi:steroid 5-alpha reductase family enzyme